MLKTTAKIIFIIIALLALTFVFARVADTDPIAMQEKYGNEYSQQVADGYGGYIHYRDQGPKDRPALLLLHGSNASLQVWEGLVANLETQYRLISFDQHGHGLTGPHGGSDYSADAKIQAALKVLEAVGVEQAVWIGSSMGGWLTLRAALAVPDRLNGMVLIDASGVQNEEQTDLSLTARVIRSSLGQLLMPQITPRFIVKTSLQKSYFDPSKLTEEQIDRYWELVRYSGNRQALVAHSNTDREPEKWNEVGSISMPTLILWGEHDSVIPVSHSAALRAAIPHSSLKTYPDAGHLPMEEIPEQVAADISNWLLANSAGVDFE